MEKTLGNIIVIIVVVLFFYFGYRDDYRRNPAQFVRTIIGVPIGMICTLIGLAVFNDRIQRWIQGKD